LWGEKRRPKKKKEKNLLYIPHSARRAGLPDVQREEERERCTIIEEHRPEGEKEAQRKDCRSQDV